MSKAKVKVLERFHLGGGVVHYPGEEIEVSWEMADKLIRRGIAKSLDGNDQPYETTAEYAEEVYEQRARDGGCGGCPKRK